MAVGIAVGITAILVFALWGRAKLDNHASAALPEKSVAVLPFLDLTEGMKEEEFADGVTEEIIDKLSKVPGLRVPTRTASFYYKYKQIPIVDIAKSLGVVYVLDGSTRKSGTSVRVAVRLVRADSGYVLWSETYDRPFTDRIAVQDEIAREVTNAVHAAITTQLHATSAWPFRCRAV